MSEPEMIECPYNKADCLVPTFYGEYGCENCSIKLGWSIQRSLDGLSLDKNEIIKYNKRG